MTAIKQHESIAQKTDISLGGHGLNQAVAAARMGAKVSMVGAIGEDIFGKDAITRLHREGIITTGIIRSETPTGIITNIHDELTDFSYKVLSPGANLEAKTLQIPLNAINQRTLLLLQDDMPIEYNRSLLQRCKENGAFSIVSVRSQESYLKLGNLADIILAPPLTEYNEDFGNILIWNSEEKAMAFRAKLPRISCTIPYQTSRFDACFAHDCFAGTLAACHQAGWDFEESLRFSRVMHNLAGTKGKTREKFPYLDEFEGEFIKLKSA